MQKGHLMQQDKEPLTLFNLHEGRTLRQINDAILSATQAVIDNDGGKGTKATVKLDLTLIAADDDKTVFQVGAKVEVKPPAPVARKGLIPLRRKGAKGTLMVEALQQQQTEIPGVAEFRSKAAEG